MAFCMGEAGESTYVGLDYHSGSVQVCVLGAAGQVMLKGPWCGPTRGAPSTAWRSPAPLGAPDGREAARLAHLPVRSGVGGFLLG